MFKSLILLIFSLCFSVKAYSQYYRTLPKGVRVFSSRTVKADVSSSYNRTKSETPYAIKIDATVENLSKLDNQLVQDGLALFKDYPEAYEKLSLGTHQIDGDAEVNVDVYALGYGFTNRLTGYVGLPIYDARVSVRYKRSRSDTNDEVAEALQKQYGDDWAQTLGNIVETMFTVDDRIIQSGLVNSLGYDALGDWSGQGLGDAELGLMYNFVKTKDYGFAATIGAIAPTGYVDDPDLLQDIGFGDGQWDAFFEIGGGYRANKIVTINAFTRLTYQFASVKRLRVPYDESIPLSDLAMDFEEKLGNKFLLGSTIDLNLSDWLTVTPGYTIEHIGKAQYISENEKANDILAKDSESFAQNFRFSARASTVDFYRKGKFFLPADLIFSYQNMVQGQNTPKVDLVEFDLRLYF